MERTGDCSGGRGVGRGARMGPCQEPTPPGQALGQQRRELALLALPPLMLPPASSPKDPGFSPTDTHSCTSPHTLSLY